MEFWIAGADRCSDAWRVYLGAGSDVDFGVFVVQEGGDGCADVGGGAAYDENAVGEGGIGGPGRGGKDSSFACVSIIRLCEIRRRDLNPVGIASQRGN